MSEKSLYVLTMENHLRQASNVIKWFKISTFKASLKSNKKTLSCVFLITVNLNVANYTCLAAQEISTPREPTKQTSVDETLFLVRVLESLYDQWPSDISDPDKFIVAANALRKDALKYQQHIKTSKLDSDLGLRFGDVVSNLDEYIKFLTNLEIIKEEAVRQLEKDSFNSGFKGGYTGAATYTTLRQSEDVSAGDALVVSLIAGGIALATDAWEKGDKRDKAEQQAIQTEARKIDDRLQTSLLQAQATAQALAKKNSWSLSEIGWELSKEQYELVARLSKADDVNGLLAISERQVSLRPRDPFIRISRNHIKSVASSDDLSTLISLAKDSYNCINLIPSDTIYNDIRLGCITVAASMATKARLVEIRKAINPLGSTQVSQVTVLLWEKAISYNPSDSSGFLRMTLALSLMCNNNLIEAQKLYRELAPLCKKDPLFCFNYACLFSRLGMGNESLAWLKDSIEYGNNNFSLIKKAPYLQYLRDTNYEKFSDLLTPKYGWSVSDDWVWDDVVLRNDSSFPLSNIILNVTLKKDYDTKSLELKHDYLLPGETKIWADVVDGVEGQWDSNSRASLSCDQTRE